MIEKPGFSRIARSLGKLGGELAFLIFREVRAVVKCLGMWILRAIGHPPFNT